MKVLYEDNHFLVLDKPAGILSQGDRSGDASVLDYAEGYIRKVKEKPGAVFTGLPHRLDRPASGCIIVARTSKGLSRMTALFKDRQIEKKYIAIVEGYPDEDLGRLKHYIKKPAYTDTGSNKVLIKSEPFDGAKEARLAYRVLASLEKSCMLMIQLETGRPHQIRAQMAEIGHPILGDIKYGSSALTPKYPGLALHAYMLEFLHPVQKIPVLISSCLPDHPVYQEYADLYDLDVLLR